MEHGLFGENYNSIKQLMGILQPLGFYWFDNNFGPPKSGWQEITYCAKPVPPLTDNASSVYGAIFDTSVLQQNWTFGSYFPTAFLAQKGGFRVGIQHLNYLNKQVDVADDTWVPYNTTGINQDGERSLKVAFARSNTGIVEGDQYISEDAAYKFNNILGGNYRWLNTTPRASEIIEWRVPDVNPFKFYSASNAFAPYSQGVHSPTEPELYFPVSLIYIPYQFTTDPLRKYVSIHSATADDNSLFYFQFAPVIR
jgi:hypothetical protein